MYLFAISFEQTSAYDKEAKITDVCFSFANTEEEARQSFTNNIEKFFPKCDSTIIGIAPVHQMNKLIYARYGRLYHTFGGELHINKIEKGETI